MPAASHGGNKKTPGANPGFRWRSHGKRMKAAGGLVQPGPAQHVDVFGLDVEITRELSGQRLFVAGGPVLRAELDDAAELAATARSEIGDEMRIDFD